MKNSFVVLIVLLILPSCNQTDNTETSDDFHVLEKNDIKGAWATTITTDSGEEINAVAIFTDDYTSNAFFDMKKNQFIGTYGGRWELQNNRILQHYEFHTMDSAMVGDSTSHNFTLQGDTLKFESGNTWIRIDNGEPGALEGAWLITGREREGEVSRMTPGTRKTMKILSGTRFQWIAYDTDGAKFYGTGGGTYTTNDSIYTENIEFFSRDSSRVGASLQFNFDLKGGEWIHTGLNSRGEPLYEIWTLRSELEGR